MRPTLTSLAAAVPLLLAGCSSWFESEDAPPCPRAALVDGADRVVRFAGEGRTPQDVAFEARILGVGGECEFTDEERRVTVDMALRIEGARGPALEGEEAPLSYFVAVVGPEGEVLAREEFATEIPLEEKRAIIVEELEPEIPLPRGRRAASYTVFVGLIVTEEELAANRR
ncbi:MAG TPA: hypothetical protein VNB28_10875 [Methylomirabilota bacterium]|jgi:hypothetical protein|nr:hypothetical protein [Methylomirabilota bacterium]